MTSFGRRSRDTWISATQSAVPVRMYTKMQSLR